VHFISNATTQPRETSTDYFSFVEWAAAVMMSLASQTE
jgi:hypothetical protein